MYAWQKISFRKVSKYTRCAQNIKCRQSLGCNLPEGKTETDKVVVSLDNIEGKAYAIVEFLKKEGDI